ncbi:MAG TPA: hypothetical protein VHE35_21580 [Kofleriaceae bacterium]|nr:hypothetical protein [Kofleriaceae bacterium]
MSPAAATAERQKAVRILAKSIYRQLTSQGYDERHIVALATELISEVTTHMASEQVAARP